MARGLPDYYNPSTLVSQRIVDLAGVMSAVAKIPPLDGRGRLAYIDTFGEGPFGVQVQATGTGGVVGMDTVIAEIPPASLKAQPGTGGVNPRIIVSRSFLADTPSAMGIEVGVSSAAAVAQIQLALNYQGPVNAMTGDIYVHTGTGLIQIVHSGGTSTLTTKRVMDDPTEWVMLKLVIDFANSVFSRFLFGQTQYDLSAYTPVSAASTYPGKGDAVIRIKNDNGVQSTVRLGHLAITTDEP